MPPPVTIEMVDYSLARLMAANPTLRGADLSLGTPHRHRPSRPLVNLFLYRVREDVQRRQAGTVRLNGRDDDRSQTVAPPRWAELGYMVSVASAQTDASPMSLGLPFPGDFGSLDSHVILQSLLGVFTATDEVPLFLPGEDNAYRYGMSALLRLNQPSEDARSAGELWSALDVPPRPFLDLAVTIPLLPGPDAITVGTWPTTVTFGITPTTGPGAPAQSRTLTGERLPEPTVHRVDRDETLGRITVTGRLPPHATGLRAWISDEDVYVSAMTSTVSPDPGTHDTPGGLLFTATGPYPGELVEATVHLVAVGDRAGAGGPVRLDSPEKTYS
ncbi:Pvc16 family protein [Embleya sp. NPDC059259]|uniref:Pvc16 family protein n=1 Tax=unclassified Embleya TaxID=2699296 RepID=UPI00367F786A